MPYVFDANGNNTLDAGETGNAGAIVTLTDSLGHQVGSPFTTDSSGAYSFTGLLPGTYTITVTSPANFAAEAANTMTIVVASGSVGTGYDFAEVLANQNF